MSELVRDFDAERQERLSRPRSFKIGGEVFTFLRGMRPEEFSEVAMPYWEITADTPPLQALEVMDKAIMGFMESEDDVERWKRLRERREEAVTAREVRAVLALIFEEQTGHPSVSPAPSPNGDGSTGENSTESSSSDQVESAVSADSESPST